MGRSIPAKVGVSPCHGFGGQQVIFFLFFFTSFFHIKIRGEFGEDFFPHIIFLQLIRLNVKGQLAQGEWCIMPEDESLIASHCRKGTVHGPFKYDKV